MAKIQIQCNGLTGAALVHEYTLRHHFSDGVGRHFALHSTGCNSTVTLVPIRAGECRGEGETGMVPLTSVLACMVDATKPELYAVPFEAALLYLDGAKLEDAPMHAVYLGARAEFVNKVLVHYFLVKNEIIHSDVVRLTEDQVRAHRVYADTILVFAEKTDEMREREATLDELAALGQEIGVGYE